MSLTVDWPGFQYDTGLFNDPRRRPGVGETMWVTETKTVPSIVYCKKCKWRLGAICTLSHLSVGPNDYCSKGEECDGKEHK